MVLRGARFGVRPCDPRGLSRGHEVGRRRQLSLSGGGETTWEETTGDGGAAAGEGEGDGGKGDGGGAAAAAVESGGWTSPARRSRLSGPARPDLASTAIVTVTPSAARPSSLGQRVSHTSAARSRLPPLRERRRRRDGDGETGCPGTDRRAAAGERGAGIRLLSSDGWYCQSSQCVGASVSAGTGARRVAL